ncbi:MAG: hypothetical protein ABJF77_16025 [Qipengyuania citrea]
MARALHPLRPATRQAYGDLLPRAIACLVAGWQLQFLVTLFL